MEGLHPSNGLSPLTGRGIVNGWRVFAGAKTIRTLTFNFDSLSHGADALGRNEMRSFINAISSDLFVKDLQDLTNVAGLLQLRADILERLRIYASRALSESAHLPGEKSPGRRMHPSAVLAVVLPGTTARGTSAGWRPEQPIWLPAFACSR